jgi:hypothetical protein
VVYQLCGFQRDLEREVLDRLLGPSEDSAPKGADAAKGAMLP